MTTPAPRHGHPPTNPWITAGGRDSIVFYRARPRAAPSTSSSSTPAFPAPHFGPRRSRPHAIRIVTYPPGYVPRELRPARPTSKKPGKKPGPDRTARFVRRRTGPRKDRPGCCGPRSCAPSVLGKLLAPFSGRSFASLPLVFFSSSSSPSPSSSSSSLHSPSGPCPPTGILAPHNATRHLDDDAGARNGCPSAPGVAIGSDDNRGSIRNINSNSSNRDSHHPPHQNHNSDNHQHQYTHHRCQGQLNSAASYRPHPCHSRDLEATAGIPATPIGLQTNVNGDNNSMAVAAPSTQVPKPVASGSGVACSILLAEPNLFLSGFDHDRHSVQRERQGGTALLRGRLRITVSKCVKIKAIQLKLLGRARTEWPEGVPPTRQDMFEEESLRNQVLTFFNVMNDGWETEFGNSCAYRPQRGPAAVVSSALSALPRVGGLVPGASQRASLSARDPRRLSLQITQSRSFGKGENAAMTPMQVKGFKVFHPGTYDYSFELPIDHHQLETTKVQYGSVRWELQATVERAGAFRPNLHGSKEVSIVRLPDQMSLEMTEPISISRKWEDQLHYDIIISGKSFPIGAKIPVAFKLTPLAKVRIHKLKVYVTESIEYWTSDRRVTRKDPTRKILLLEKVAGKPLDPAWSSSDIQTIRGGEQSAEERQRAREMALRRRATEAYPTPLPRPSDNLLGDLDLGLESMWGSTELEANIQLPTCEMMAKNKELRLHPDCSWKNVQVYHWIKIVMRISRPVGEDTTGTKRRHFEISIDSPFTVLNCRATQANTSLPAYLSPVTASNTPCPSQAACGCPDAAWEASPSSSTGHLPGAGMDALPMPPRPAHLPDSPVSLGSGWRSSMWGPTDNAGAQADYRPIHLLRAPSFNPPAFEDDTAPPPATAWTGAQCASRTAMATPPPQYDTVIGTPSVDGLADYFARLADYGFDNRLEDDYSGSGSGSDSDQHPTRILDRTGRVNVSHPKAAGGRIPSRSMEITRPPGNLGSEAMRERDGRTAKQAAHAAV